MGKVMKKMKRAATTSSSSLPGEPTMKKAKMEEDKATALEANKPSTSTRKKPVTLNGYVYENTEWQAIGEKKMMPKAALHLPMDLLIRKFAEEILSTTTKRTMEAPSKPSSEAESLLVLERYATYASNPEKFRVRGKSILARHSMMQKNAMVEAVKIGTYETPDRQEMLDYIGGHCFEWVQSEDKIRDDLELFMNGTGVLEIEAKIKDLLVDGKAEDETNLRPIWTRVGDLFREAVWGDEEAGETVKKLVAMARTEWLLSGGEGDKEASSTTTSSDEDEDAESEVSSLKEAKEEDSDDAKEGREADEKIDVFGDEEIDSDLFMSDIEEENQEKDQEADVTPASEKVDEQGASHSGSDAAEMKQNVKFLLDYVLPSHFLFRAPSTTHQPGRTQGSSSLDVSEFSLQEILEGKHAQKGTNIFDPYNEEATADKRYDGEVSFQNAQGKKIKTSKQSTSMTSSSSTGTSSTSMTSSSSTGTSSTSITSSTTTSTTKVAAAWNDPIMPIKNLQNILSKEHAKLFSVISKAVEELNPENAAEPLEQLLHAADETAISTTTTGCRLELLRAAFQAAKPLYGNPNVVKKSKRFNRVLNEIPKAIKKLEKELLQRAEKATADGQLGGDEQLGVVALQQGEHQVLREMNKNTLSFSSETMRRKVAAKAFRVAFASASEMKRGELKDRLVEFFGKEMITTTRTSPPSKTSGEDMNLKEVAFLFMHWAQHDFGWLKLQKRVLKLTEDGSKASTQTDESKGAEQDRSKKMDMFQFLKSCSEEADAKAARRKARKDGRGGKK
ncbi:unnamed protein product [Amoebophrya sp. A25]|nr:unnamed protein product [Amoebophrya sp. A25]|eukprot:GSA25T00009296001.1